MFQKVQLDKKKYGRESQTFFKVYCPGQYKHHPQKLIMQDNGSVSKNVEYKSICTEKFLIQIAYNNNRAFRIEYINGRYIWFTTTSHGQYVGLSSSITKDYEILLMFLKHYNTYVGLTNCNYTWGTYDDETGKWTGAVGQVKGGNLKMSHFLFTLGVFNLNYFW